MKHRMLLSLVLALVPLVSAAQDAGSTSEGRYNTRYAVALINDATIYSGLSAPIPSVLNQVLLEPSFNVILDHRWNFSTSLIGASTTYSDTSTQVRVKETYGGLSAGDFDFLIGRKMVRWGTGYAFTAAGVLDPPRVATDPTDRLNLNEGGDMVKADWVRGPHALTLAWSTAALARKGTNLRDTTAFRYNVLMHGFDTSLIAGNDRGGDSFGAFTFTRVVGQAWEMHGEAAWREHAAILIGAKYTMSSGVTFIGEFYTPPNNAYYRGTTLSPDAGRQHYSFVSAGKTRLRELPGWKEWNVSGAMVANLDDRSYTSVFDVSRWFGNHISSYVHADVPVGSKRSEYGAAPYSAATSMGIRFQL
jgi:hypothetical protein